MAAPASVSGVAAVSLGQFSLLGLFIIAQATLNLYMKFVMSSVVVAPGVNGIPASFLVTGLQQLVAFILFLGLLPFRRWLAKGSQQTRLSFNEWLFVLCMAGGFALNMGLNNLSLAFIPLSVNQVIRACGPLVTAVLQVASGQGQDASRTEWLLMMTGVICAVVTVVARAEGSLASESGYVFGALVCALSVLFAAADYVLKQMTGTKLKMSSVDAMGYMALPAFLFLLLPGILWEHPVPVSWIAQLERSSAGSVSGTWTDVAVLLKGSELRPALLGFVAVSGAIAFGYNALTTFLAVRLSATTASMVGNIPTSTVISLLVLERRLPTGAWGALLWAGVFGNVAAFAAYSAAKRRRNNNSSRGS